MNKILTILLLSVAAMSAHAQPFVVHNLVCWDSAGVVTTLSRRAFEVNGETASVTYRDLLTNEIVTPTTGTIADCNVITSLNIIGALDTIDTGCNGPDTSIYSTDGSINADRAAYIDGSLTFARPDSQRMLFISEKDSLVAMATGNGRGTVSAGKDRIEMNHLNTGILFLDDTVAMFRDNRGIGLRRGLEYQNPQSGEWTDNTLITKGYFLSILSQAASPSIYTANGNIPSLRKVDITPTNGQGVKFFDTGNENGYYLWLDPQFGARFNRNTWFNTNVNFNGGTVTMGTTVNFNNPTNLGGTTSVNLAGTSVFNITDTRSTTTGLTYDADYSAGFTDRTLVDKAYVDSNTKTYSAGNYIDVSSGGAISFDPSEATNTSAQVVPSNADVLFEINNGLWQNFMDASWFNTVNYANASMQPTDNTKINVSGYTRTMYKWNGANCNCSNSVHLNDYATSSRESGNNSRRLYYINNLSAGDTLEIFRGTTASPSTKIYEFNASNIGGMVMLVYNENNVWEAHELSNPSATGGGASLGAAVNGGMAVNADSMELDRDNFLDDVPLEVLGSDDELLVYDSDATGKKFRRVQLDKIHSGKRIGVVSTPASGGVQTGITPAYPSFVNSNIFVVKGNNGGDGNVNVDLGPGTQDGLTVREVIVVLEDFNPDETVTIQDDGVVKKVFDRNVSFVMCVFDGTDWKLYPAANPEHIGNSGESGGGYKSYTGLTWNTTAPGNIGIFYSTYLQPEAGVSHYFVMKDPAPGTQHYVEIDDSDTWNNGDIVRIFSTGNANATKFGFWFDGYSASNIKNIDGNTTTTIAQGNGDPTLELNPDNASWLEIVHYGGQWYLMGTDE